MNIVFLCLPVVFLIVSALFTNRSVKRGVKRRRAVITQIASFVFVCAICLAVPTVVSAASTGAAAAGAAGGAAAAAAAASDKGMSMLAVAIASGISSIGGGIAVATSAPAAIGATGEDSKVFGKALIFVALGEGIAIYGLLIAILMLQKIQ